MIQVDLVCYLMPHIATRCLTVTSFRFGRYQRSKFILCCHYRLCPLPAVFFSLSLASGVGYTVYVLQLMHDSRYSTVDNRLPMVDVQINRWYKTKLETSLWCLPTLWLASLEPMIINLLHAFVMLALSSQKHQVLEININNINEKHWLKHVSKAVEAFHWTQQIMVIVRLLIQTDTF